VSQADPDSTTSLAAPTGGPASLPNTHWSVVLAAGQASNPAAQAALEQLCRVYWYPLYVYVRRRGYSPEDAQDLTQSFFERLLERDLLADLRPTGARFRSYLLHAMKNLLASEWVRAHADKRGGRRAILSLDELGAEARFAPEAGETEAPDAAFERRWAGTVLQSALERLRQEQVANGKQAEFEVLANCLTGAAPGQPYATIAVQLGMTEAAVKMTIHRLRKRYGEILRLEVAQTVLTPGEVDEELRHLLTALAQR
jgi:RNA polymerase sigma-70 factor (ECF subfamily)